MIAPRMSTSLNISGSGSTGNGAGAMPTMTMRPSCPTSSRASAAAEAVPAHSMTIAGASPAEQRGTLVRGDRRQAEPLRALCAARVARDERDLEALLAGDESREQADRPGPDDDGALAGLRLGAAERVDRDRRRLDQGAGAIVHGFREREQHARVDDHALGVGARAPGAEPYAVGHGGAADLLAPAPARGALPALREREDARAIARSPPRHALPHRADRSRHLVPRHRSRREQRGDVAEVQVRAADPAVGDVERDLAGAGLRPGPLDDQQRTILGDLDGAHGARECTNPRRSAHGWGQTPTVRVRARNPKAIAAASAAIAAEATKPASAP